MIPVGAFLVEHFYTNAYSIAGERVYNDHVAVIMGLPYLYAIEILTIGLPILFHGLLGVWIALRGEVNLGSQNRFRNWMYVLQRATGAILLLYIAWHVWTTRFAGSHNLFELMASHLSNPLYFAFYVVGVLSATFHFSNGLWSFMVTWGVTVSPKAQKLSTFACAGIFVAMSLVGLNSLLGFTGGAVTFLNP